MFQMFVAILCPSIRQRYSIAASSVSESPASSHMDSSAHQIESSSLATIRGRREVGKSHGKQVYARRGKPKVFLAEKGDR
jgi:hypothetical protein